MSGSSARAITLRLSVDGAAKLQEDLRNLGTAGEEALRRLEAAVTKSGAKGAGLPQISTAAKEATENFGGMTAKLQGAGYQLQDFAVQVQGGTSAMTALSQQGSQFLGAFGPAGAIAGAILTVGILAMKLLDTAASVDAINKANEAWKKNQSDINALLESGIEKTIRLRREQVETAAAPQRTALQAATYDREKAVEELAALERDLARARGTDNRAAPRRGTLGRQNMVVGNEEEISSLEAQVASARDRIATQTRLAAEAAATLRALHLPGPPGSAASLGGADPGQVAILDSQAALARERRLAGLSGPKRAIESARIAAEEEADRATNDPGERQVIIANRVAAAIAAQEAATTSLGAAETKRMATAMRQGETEILRSKEQLALAEALAAAGTPREAMLARQAFEIEKSTVALRGRIEIETDPRIRAALVEQVELIRQQRLQAVGLEETTRNRSALYQQGAAFARQGAERQAIGMSDGDRARYLGSFSERQRIEGAGGDPESSEALERIRNAGELAYGDEQLQRLKEFTSSVRSVGDAFAQSFSQAGLEGRKLGDVLDSLQRQIAASIFRSTVGRFIDQSAGMIGSAIGSYFMGPSATPAPAATPQYGGLYANGGIMTPYGDLPLRKYAGGGIAHSPQVAIFGEARRPEAYVPLPDGRSIPVTMAGGGGATINIDARGADAGVEQRIDAVLARRMPAILAAGRADLTGRVNQGGNIARTFGRR